MCWVTICWPPTSAALVTRTIANGQPLPERCRASYCRVLCRIFAAIAVHTDVQFLQADCVVTGRSRFRYNRTTGAQSMACVCGYAWPACWRGDTDHWLLIDYYITNIDYENKQSLTSLPLTDSDAIYLRSAHFWILEQIAKDMDKHVACTTAQYADIVCHSTQKCLWLMSAPRALSTQHTQRSCSWPEQSGVGPVLDGLTALLPTCHSTLLNANSRHNSISTVDILHNLLRDNMYLSSLLMVVWVCVSK